MTKLSLRPVIIAGKPRRGPVSREAIKTFVMPAPVSNGVNSQGNSYTTYSNGGYSYSNAPSSSNSNSGSHYYSPSGGTSGFYTQNGERALHLQTRTTNLSSQIVPFRVWQVDNPVAGTPTTRTLQERARTSESCDLSPRRRPPRSACTTRALPETPARSSSRLIVAARVSVTPWVLPEARLRSRPPGRALRPWRALRRTVPTVTVISPVSCGERAVWNQILKYHHLDHDIATDTTLAIRIATIRSALSRVATRVYHIGICTSQHAHLDLDLRPSSQVIVVSHISDHTRRRSLRYPDAGVAQRLLRHT